MRRNPIVECHELLTDGKDVVEKFFTITCESEDGTPAEITITLKAAQELRALLDAVPELAGGNW